MPNFPDAYTVSNTSDAATATALAALMAGLSEVMVEFPIPAALAPVLARVPGWKLYASRFGRRAVSNRTPREIFDYFSTAATAPAGEFHVDIASGSDANDGLSAGTAFKSIYKGQQALAALGSTGGIIHVYATGHYLRSNNFYGAAANQQCTVPTLFVAHGGIVDTSTADAITWTQDGTYTNCYTSSVASSDWTGVYDMLVWDARNRGYGELRLVSSAAICNRTPGSYFITGTTLYVNRADGVAPTNGNTRACRGVYNFRVNSALVPVGLVGASEGDGWSFLGGPATAGGVSYLPLQALPNPAQLACFVADNLRTQGGFHGISINNTYGVNFLNNCGGTGPIEDWANIHNNKGSVCDTVATNPWGRDAGRPGHVSCQLWTQHDNPNCRAIIACPDFDNGGGGLIRNIGGSQCQVVYPKLGVDKGDKVQGGSVDPVAVRGDDAGTTIYLLDAEIAPGNIYDVLAYGSAEVLNQGRPLRMVAQDSGTVGSWT